MSEDDDQENSAEEIADLPAEMSPGVRLCLERGDAIRVAKAEMASDIEQFVTDLIELYPGHEDTIRKGLEGAAAQLLAIRDKRKRDERRAKEEAIRAAKAAAASANGGDEPATNPGANGVSKGILGSV